MNLAEIFSFLLHRSIHKLFLNWFRQICPKDRAMALDQSLVLCVFCAGRLGRSTSAGRVWSSARPLWVEKSRVTLFSWLPFAIFASVVGPSTWPSTSFYNDGGSHSFHHVAVVGYIFAASLTSTGIYVKVIQRVPSTYHQDCPADELWTAGSA